VQQVIDAVKHGRESGGEIFVIMSNKWSDQDSETGDAAWERKKQK
jgi:hypothetical protein